jgi:hypothetical protein
MQTNEPIEPAAPDRAMPRYRCHKEVCALQIKAVAIDLSTLVFSDPGFAPITLTPEWLRKHSPQPGGYYVVYSDGYTSYSPQKAFEEGYTRLPS